MNRGVIALLLIVLLGVAALYAIRIGPALFIRPPAEERIAFLSDRSGNQQVWTMKTDGSAPEQITTDPFRKMSPKWSWSSTEIAYVCDVNKRGYQVFIVGWNGNYLSQFTQSYGSKDFPSWSGDNSRLIYVSGGSVCTRPRRGGTEEQLLPPTSLAQGMASVRGAEPYTFAEWSKGGDYLLFTQSTETGSVGSVAQVDGAKFDESEFNPQVLDRADYVNVAFDRSGSRIAAACINNKGVNSLNIYDLQTMRKSTVFTRSGDTSGPAAPAWSADGEMVAFEVWSVVDGSPDKPLGIYTVRLPDGKPQLVLAGNAREPSWSPSGKQLTCSLADENGKRDIWRLNADGSNAVNLTKGEGDNSSPRWSPVAR